MITKMTLKNWKSHEETTLEFGRGVNLLIGIMGSGKSSVLDAMSFALFGTFPGASHRRLKLADVITGRPRAADSARVDLSFEAGGERYSVMRTVERKGAGVAELRKDGILAMSDPEKVTEEVSRILKLDYDVFCRAVYAEQNRMDYLLSLSPADRKREMDGLLGIDKFELARANAQTAANALKRMRAEAVKALASADGAALAAAAAAARADAGGLAARMLTAQGALAAASAAAREAGEKLAAAGAARKEWEALARERAGVEHSLAAAARELAAFPAGGLAGAGPLSARVAELERADGSLALQARDESRALAEAAGREGVLRAAASELERARQRHDAARAGLETIDGGAPGASSRADAARAAHRAAQGRLAALEARRAELASALSDLSRGGAHCPTCERELAATTRDALIAAKRAALASTGEARRAANAALADSSEAVARAENEAADASRAIERLLELEEAIARNTRAPAELAAASRRVAESRERSASLDEARSALAAELSPLRERLAKSRERESALARERESRTRLEQVAARLSALGFDADAFERARAAAEDARRASLSLEGDVRLIEEKESAARERLAAREAEVRAFEGRAREAARLEAAFRSATLVQEALAETQGVLRSELIEAIDAMLADLWPVVYPYGDYSSARLRATDSDYSLELQSGDAWLTADGAASGGERACALLALRIAMAIVIVPNLRWLVLDEPTHNLDEQGVRALVGVLRDRLPELVGQVFVITHDEALREAAGAALYRFGRDKAAGEPTSVLEAA